MLCNIIFQRLPAVLSRIGVILASPLVSYFTEYIIKLFFYQITKLFLNYNNHIHATAIPHFPFLFPPLLRCSFGLSLCPNIQFSFLHLHQSNGLQTFHFIPFRIHKLSVTTTTAPCESCVHCPSTTSLLSFHSNRRIFLTCVTPVQLSHICR